MVILKPQNAEAFFKKPDTNQRVILIFGPDQGLVLERTHTLLKALGDPDPLNHTEFDSTTINQEPEKLLDEAYAIAMFGGRRTIRVNLYSGTLPIKPIETLLNDPPPDCVLIISASDLKKTNPLRKRIEAHKNGLAIACYEDSARDLEQLINQITGEHNLTLDAQTRQFIKDHLGKDRGISRSELEKLCLFVMGNAHISLEDAQNSLVDASSNNIDTIFDAAFSGQSNVMQRHLDHFFTHENGQAVQLMIMLQRQCHILFNALAKINTGTNIEAAITAIQPPIFFKRKEIMSTILHKWTLAKIEPLIEEVQKTSYQSRLHSELAPSFCSRLLLRIASLAKR